MYKHKSKIKNNLYEFYYHYPKVSQNIFIDKEIDRIFLMKKIEKSVRNNFKIEGFSLLSKCLNENNHTDDPILCKLSKNVIKDDLLLSYLNKQIIKLIKKLNSKTYQKKLVNKRKLEKKIFLFYNNYNVDINIKTYKRIKKQIVNKSYKKYIDFDTLLWILYFRYKEFGLYNNSQVSVHPIHYSIFKKKFNLNVECFGSFFNHILKNYFGIFPDLEKYMGCLGNFYNSKFVRGFYIVNPPYTTDHILDSLKHCLKMLNQSKKELYFLFIIPTLVSKNREKLNKKCNKKLKIENYDNIYDNFFKKLGEKDFLKKYLLYCKENYNFYSYLIENKVNVSPVTMILLSNSKIDLNLEEIFGASDVRNK